MEEEEAEELGCGFVEDRNPRLLRSGNDDDEDEEGDQREEDDEIAYVEEVYSLDVQIRRAMRELQAEATGCNPALVAEQFRLETQQALAGLQPCKLLAHHRSFLRAIRAKDKAKARERATHFVYQPLQPEELMVDDLLIALNELRALRCVEIYGCHLLSSEAYVDLTALAICNKVVSMQLYSVPGLHGHGLLELIKLPSLRSFKATGCSNIYDPDIVAVAKQLALAGRDGWQHAKLRELTLSNTKMTIVGLHALMSAATGILELGLSDSAFLRPDLQAERALGSFEKNSTVGHLDLSRCVGAPSVLTEAILSCRFLQRLVLQAVPAVTDDLIRIVSCSCLHLTHLIVRDCVALSDEAVLTVSATAIVLLDIRGCPNISAAAVANLLELRSSLQDPAVLITVLHDSKDVQGDLWLSNQTRAQRAVGTDAPIPTFAAETTKPPPAPTTTSSSEAIPAAGDGGAAAAAAAPTKKRKFTLKASIPSKKLAMASASAADSAAGTAQDALTLPPTPTAAPISNPAGNLWSFLQSKMASCDQLWPLRLEIGSLRESFTLPSWHVFRFMSSYQLMPAVVLPDVLRRAGAYVLMERPEHKYILCSQTALKYPWCNKKTGEPVWFDIKFEPISHKALRDAVQLLFDSLRACMDGNDLPPALGFASWTEVWWASSLQRLRIGWRESDDTAAGVDVVPRLEPLPQDPEAAFQIVSADQGMVLRDVDGKVYRLASKAVLDFVLSQESNPS